MIRRDDDTACITIKCGFDSTLMRAKERGGVDLIATSPPYACARTYGAGVDWSMADYAAFGDAAFDALKPGGWLLLNLDAPVREWRKGFGTERGLHPWRVMLDYADRIGFRVPDRLAFGRLGVPGEYKGRFRNDWEPLLWFQRPGGAGYFDKTVLDSKAKQSMAGVVARSREVDGSQYVRAMTGDAVARQIRRRGTLWDYDNVTQGCTGATDIERERHPARWPYRLAVDIVGCFAPPGGLVVDPFVGAGTTAAAAVALGRAFVGGDLLDREDGVPWALVAARVAARRLTFGEVEQVSDVEWRCRQMSAALPYPLRERAADSA